MVIFKLVLSIISHPLYPRISYDYNIYHILFSLWKWLRGYYLRRILPKQWSSYVKHKTLLNSTILTHYNIIYASHIYFISLFFFHIFKSFITSTLYRFYFLSSFSSYLVGFILVLSFQINFYSTFTSSRLLISYQIALNLFAWHCFMTLLIFRFCFVVI